MTGKAAARRAMGMGGCDGCGGDKMVRVMGMGMGWDGMGWTGDGECVCVLHVLSNEDAFLGFEFFLEGKKRKMDVEKGRLLRGGP